MTRLLSLPRQLVDRLARPMVLAALVACCWLALLLDWMLFRTWFWPTATVNAAVAGLVAGWISGVQVRGAELAAASNEVIKFNSSADRDDLAEITTCGLCGRTPAVGVAYVEGVRYCTGEGEVCYRRVSRRRTVVMFDQDASTADRPEREVRL